MGDRPVMARLGLWTRMKLLTGRPRRLFDNLVRRREVHAALAQRRGKCLQCGACCQMGSRCPFLFYNDGLAMCKMYHRRRSPNCRNFPMSERDIAERDIVCPSRKCGYTFDNNTV